jgi:hypothetical protein
MSPSRSRRSARFRHLKGTRASSRSTRSAKRGSQPGRSPMMSSTNQMWSGWYGPLSHFSSATILGAPYVVALAPIGLAPVAGYGQPGWSPRSSRAARRPRQISRYRAIHHPRGKGREGEVRYEGAASSLPVPAPDTPREHRIGIHGCAAGQGVQQIRQVALPPEEPHRRQKGRKHSAGAICRVELHTTTVPRGPGHPGHRLGCSRMRGTRVFAQVAEAVFVDDREARMAPVQRYAPTRPPTRENGVEAPRRGAALPGMDAAYSAGAQAASPPRAEIGRRCRPDRTGPHSHRPSSGAPSARAHRGGPPPSPPGIRGPSRRPEGQVLEPSARSG